MSQDTKPKPCTTARLIKKYPNRRLYDTAISRYITLEEIRHLVLKGIDFRVVDKKSDKDITRTILLQVIAEQEEDGDPIFSTSYLQEIIRFYGDSLQHSVSRYMEQSLDLFIEQQQQFKDRLKSLAGHNPIHQIRELTKQNIPLWQAIRKELITDLAGLRGHDDDGKSSSKKEKNTTKTKS